MNPAAEVTYMPDDREWIKQVVADYQGRLCRYALHLTGDLDAARDVVQETFLRLCKQRREQLDGHLLPWLLTVCRSRAIDRARKERRMTTLQPEMPHAIPSSAVPPQAESETREEQTRVIAALGAISSGQAEVIRLKFQEGLSYRQISEVTGISVSNVGYRIHMGLKALKNRLGGS